MADLAENVLVESVKSIDLNKAPLAERDSQSQSEASVSLDGSRPSSSQKAPSAGSSSTTANKIKVILNFVLKSLEIKLYYSFGSCHYVCVTIILTLFMALQ